MYIMYSLGLWCGRKYGFVDVYMTVTNMIIFDCFYNLFFVYKSHPVKIFFRFNFCVAYDWSYEIKIHY